MKNNIVDFNKKREQEMREAYYWSLEFQRQHGFYSEPTRITFPEGDKIDDGDGVVIVSLFVDDETKRASLRRDWPDDMTVKFNTVTNYQEIKEKAPKSYNKMVQNGLDLYRKGKK